jgi:ABC-2 type transport system ATP-binding protein
MTLTIDRLTKTYGRHQALRHVSLTTERTGLIGLIGPNGAGKTTLIRIIATLLPPTSGTVTWNGHDTQHHGHQIRTILGYLPQEFGVYPELTGRAFLRYLAAMKGLPKSLARTRVDDILDQVNLTTHADQRLRTYSGGMKQRIGIAQAILNDPEILIVDEPTAGLDPAERIRFRGMIANLARDRLVILSTHIVSDVEAAAARLIVLANGTIRADATTTDFIAAAHSNVWTLTCDPATATHLQTTHPVSGVVTYPTRVTIRLLTTKQPHPHAQPAEPTLEDAYLTALTQQPG